MRLKNKTILITGASRGIGLAIAERCLDEGAIVVANYRNQLAGIVSLSEKYGKDKVVSIRANVASASEVCHMMECVGKELDCLDGIVCNAGIITRTPDWKNFPLEEWECIFKTNLIGTWNIIRYGVDLMKNGGSIVNISSIYGTNPDAKSLPYSVSKAAVIALTQALSKELAPSIRINAVLPGNTITDMVPNESEQKRIEKMTLLKRSALPLEIANSIVFLLSNESSYITSDVLHVDGGFHVK